MARDLEPDHSETESDSGEAEEESEEEVSSDSDSEPKQNVTAKNPLPSPPPSAKKSQSQPFMTQKEQMKEQLESDSETESESGSETESDGPIPFKRSGDVYVKPQPMVSDPSNAIRSAGAKRPTEEKDEGKDPKKSKTKAQEFEDSPKKSNDDPKKQLFQRLWSEGDEIVILKGMIDYAEKNKSDPLSDLNAFHSFIKENLHVDVSRNQLQDKIRRLRKKYENNKSKEKEGKERNFSKPHEQKAYKLSKRIWGNENVKDGSPKSNGSVLRNPYRNNAVENGEFGDVKNVEVVNGTGVERIWSSNIMRSNEVSMHDRIYRIGSELFDGKSGIEGEKEWKRLGLEEMELHMMMLDVLRARTKLVMDALKSNDQ